MKPLQVCVGGYETPVDELLRASTHIGLRSTVPERVLYSVSRYKKKSDSNFQRSGKLC